MTASKACRNNYGTGVNLHQKVYKYLTNHTKQFQVTAQTQNSLKKSMKMQIRIFRKIPLHEIAHNSETIDPRAL